MNTPPATGYAGVRPAFGEVGPDEDDRFKHWVVIDRRDGAPIHGFPPPQEHNLQDAIDSLTHECDRCTVGLTMLDAPTCPRCGGSGLEPDLEVESDPPLCTECRGDGNIESCGVCEDCGRLGPDSWMSPQGQAEALAGELNAILPGPIGCGYCNYCGYGGEGSDACLHKQDPTIEDLYREAVRLRIEGVVA